MTKRQNEARRANSQKSTGPRTEAGKARSSMNALKTGIDAETAVLPNENPEAYQQVVADWHGHYQPVTPATRTLVDRLATTEWLFRRYARIESTLLAMYIADHPDRIDKNFPDAHAFLHECSPIGRIQVRVNALDRTFHKDLDQLTYLQTTGADLDPVGTPSEIAPEIAPNDAPQPADPAPDNPSSASFPETSVETPAEATPAQPANPVSAPAASAKPGDTPRPLETWVVTAAKTDVEPLSQAGPLGKCA